MLVGVGIVYFHKGNKVSVSKKEKLRKIESVHQTTTVICQILAVTVSLYVLYCFIETCSLIIDNEIPVYMQIYLFTSGAVLIVFLKNIINTTFESINRKYRQDIIRVNREDKTESKDNV